MSKIKQVKFGMYRIVSIALLIVVILVTSMLFYRVMIGFFIPLFLAALLVVLFHPLHGFFIERFKNRAKIAAMATTVAILLIVLLPSCVLIGVASLQATHLFKDLNLGSIDVAYSRVLNTAGLQLPLAEQLESVDEDVALLNQSLSPEGSDHLVDRLEDQLEKLREEVARTHGAKFTESFKELEAELELIRSHAADSVDGTVESSDDASAEPPEHQYHSRVTSITKQYRSLKNDISGGPIMGPIRQAVNPTAKKREEWIKLGLELVQPRVVQATQATATFAGKTLFGIAILTISIYFFLIDGPAMTNTIMKLSPLDDRYERELLGEFEKVSRAVVLATFLSALAQGTLAMIGYYFAGLESIVLLFLLTTFMALIPFLGAASVWFPCAMWLGFVQNNWPAAIGLAIYGAIVISMIDNVIKPYVLQGQSNLHPLLALLSVIGGVQVFGPIGILMGPMIVVFLQTLLEILNRELTHLDAQPE